MKGIDIFCSSSSSIAICRSIDVSSLTRHGSIEGKSSMRKSLIPGLPSKPKGFHHLHHHQEQKKSKHSSTSVISASSPSSSSAPASSTRAVHGQNPKNSTEGTASSASGSSRFLFSKVTAFNKNKQNPSPPSTGSHGRKSKKISESKSPSNSSRYLLSDTSILSILPDIETLPALLSVTPIETDPSPIKHSPATPTNQVVVLKVSIHCKGCEMKVRKHISRMEGVSSFTIDAKTKKVTIVGDVSPMGVLQSVSRVKYAQFWSSPAANS